MFRRTSLILALSFIATALARSPPNERAQASPFNVEGRHVSQNLYIDNPYHKSGKWGIIELCSNGSFVSAVEVKYSPPGHLDETAINGIKLYCSTTDGHNTGYVTSSVGKNGDWYGMRMCPSDFVTGFRANTLEYQGLFVDDVAVENFQFDCDYGKYIVDGLPVAVPVTLPEPNKFRSGEWSSFSTCRQGLAVCGLQTRYEDGSLGDETAIDEVVLFCCDRNLV